jgi:hypothetical protein
VRVRWVTPIVIMTHGETMAQLGRDGALTMECITSKRYFLKKTRYFLTSLLVVATEFTPLSSGCGAASCVAPQVSSGCGAASPESGCGAASCC